MAEEHPIKIKRWLYPAALLYGAGVNLRNKLFDWGVLRSESFDVPVICIGNIAVGGTGKTPHTEYLIRLLQKENNVAVLSRGYKRKTKGYQLATEDSTVRMIGDEPLQIKKKFPGIHVAVDKNRRHGIKKICQLTNPEVEVILLDDAFQHRYVQTGINILLTDYNRLFCDDALLPAGLLRESTHARYRAQIVIVTKCPPDIKPIEFNILAKRLHLYPYQELYFSTLRYGRLTPVCADKETSGMELSDISKDQPVLLVTGIASPFTMIEEIKKYTEKVETLSFSDHHNFSNKDIQYIQERFYKIEGDDKILITTEKDAERLREHPRLSDELKQRLFVLPIEIEFLQNQQNTFNQHIIGYVRKNKRNSILSSGKDANKP